MEERLGLGRASAGFMLVELLIAMVVATSATIAYSSYQDSLRNGRRAAAPSFLVETARRPQHCLVAARGDAIALLREIQRANESRDAGVT